MKRLVVFLNLLVLAAVVTLDVFLILNPSLALKSAASACFVLGGIINAAYALKNKGNIKFTVMMLIALVFAMAGDIVIYNSADLYFITGAALFAIAHVFYLIAYCFMRGFRLTDILFAACIFVPSVLVITLVPIFNFGGVLMEVVCVIYALILSLMVGKALSDLRTGSAVSVIIAVGSILFFVSDLSLLLNTFGNIGKVSSILCLATYYPAQFLLAFAVFVYALKGMNFFKAAYCRIFQTVLKIALPLLPYKDPKILEKISDIPDTLKASGKTKPLIVTDKTIKGLGLAAGLEKSLASAGIQYAVYDGVVANPTTDNTAEALKIYKQENCDCLIAFGGGSPMDCAKGVGALIAKPKKSLNDLRGILKVGKKIPLLIAIPTTAGTGSETTLAAVIVDAKTRHKYAINDFPLIPSYAVLDEEVTMTLPQKVVSTTGMDALTHATEAFIGRGGNKSTRRDALEACKLTFENIEASYKDADRTARKNMLIASHKAGRAFSKAYVGYVHALAHSLGGKYDVPHGLANAVILPTVLKEYGKAVYKKLWKIAVYCNLADKDTPYKEGAEIIISKIESLNVQFGIPKTIPAICEGDIEEFATYADREANPLYPVPVLWNKDKLKELYLRIKGGESLPADDIQTVIAKQRAYFKSGKTLEVKHRLRHLKALYSAINDNLDIIHEGLKKDLGKSESESYMCETGLVLSELSYMIKHVKKFSRPKRVLTPLAQFKSKSYRLPSPYGNVLVMNPWNYPVLLSLDPLIDAVAAGNVVTLKLSAYSPNTNEAIKKVIESVFSPEYVAVIFGGRQANEELINSKFDYVFFTGSKKVGKLVYEKAAENLTPVTLELGGKSPCIVDETANIPLAAKRIVWGKFLNLGQTCVAPDYIFCAEAVHDKLVSELKKQIDKQFGENPLENPAYGKIITEKHFTRVCGLIDEKKVVHGGRSDKETLKIEPTVLDGVSLDDAVMQEEIFGPVLPIITYRDESEVMKFVSENDAPLAFYLFSSNKKRIKKFTTELGFGGGCVNDVVIHLATSNMPFGGFGASGLGAYHGKMGFETFTHYKSIVDKATFMDLPMRYQPFKKFYDKIVKLFLR